MAAYSINITAEQVREFNQGWSASQIPVEAIWFEFDEHHDLVAMSDNLYDTDTSGEVDALSRKYQDKYLNDKKTASGEAV